MYWFLDKGDVNSTSNLLHHAKICWGVAEVKTATVTCDVEVAYEVLAKAKLQDGSILAEFEHIGKANVTYQHTQHMTTEATSGKTPFADLWKLV